MQTTIRTDFLQKYTPEELEKDNKIIGKIRTHLNKIDEINRKRDKEITLINNNIQQLKQMRRKLYKAVQKRLTSKKR